MWVGLFLNFTTPIQLAVTTATFGGSPGVGVETTYYDEDFVRDDFVEIILNSSWPD